jgi:hypothetical protein
MGSLLETRYYVVGQQRGLCAAAQLSSAQLRKSSDSTPPLPRNNTVSLMCNTCMHPRETYIHTLDKSSLEYLVLAGER